MAMTGRSLTHTLGSSTNYTPNITHNQIKFTDHIKLFNSEKSVETEKIQHRKIS